MYSSTRHVFAQPLTIRLRITQAAKSSSPSRNAKRLLHQMQQPVLNWFQSRPLPSLAFLIYVFVIYAFYLRFPFFGAGPEYSSFSRRRAAIIRPTTQTT